MFAESWGAGRRLRVSHRSLFRGKPESAPGDERPSGGIKVIPANGWFAARPSGTEAVYKLYAESVKGENHLHRIQEEAQAVIARALGARK